ncbi:hypothetical protein CDL15_Pgr012910 [Punica granatum]|uniref:Uncharacterized protein n=1 Tax=Punica granatum TaxID=22663 RepID=A0A218XFF6_PUNGR|nr:hypothetical protein CDL15_Pgr012910 [Punica granatum]
MALFSNLFWGCFSDANSSRKRVGSCEEAGDDSLSHNCNKVAEEDSKPSKSSLTKRKSPPIPVAYFPMGSRLSLL